MVVHLRRKEEWCGGIAGPSTCEGKMGDGGALKQISNVRGVS